MKVLRKKFQVAEFKQIDSKTGQFIGSASVYDILDQGSDVVVNGSFSKSLIDWKNAGTLPVMPWLHDMKSLAGEWELFDDSQKQLQGTGTTWSVGNHLGRTPTDVGNTAANLLQSSGSKMLSIGFIPTKVSYGKKDDKDARFIEEGKLLETSIVPFGMNQESHITDVKSIISQTDGKIESPKIVEEALRDAFCLTRNQAKAFMAGGYERLKLANNGDSMTKSDADGMDEIVAAVAALRLVHIS